MRDMGNASPAPPRQHLCLGCRTALAAEEACDLCGDQGDVVSLTEGESRRRAMRAAWRTVVHHVPRRPSGGVLVTLVLVLGTGGSTAGAVWAGMSGGGPLAGLIAVGGATLTALLVVAVVVGWDDATVRERQPVPAPTIPRPPESAVVTGVVTSTSPGSELAAWAMEVRVAREESRGVMLRDGHTAGFELSPDEGPHLQVAPGRVRWLGSPARGRALRADEATARLCAVDPAYEPGASSPFPDDEVVGWQLRLGDRVAIVTSDPHEAAAHGYRTEAILRIPTPVWLRPAEPPAQDGD